MQIPKYERRSQLMEMEQQDENTFVCSFSSESPCKRFFGNEILMHDPDSVNFERIKGMAFLWNHDQDKVLGKVEKSWIGMDRRGYAEIRWSKSENAQKYRSEVNDGILSNISVAYSIDDVQERGGDYYIKWTPLEISLVSVPVDHSVGIGRSLSEDTINVENQGGIMTIEQESDQRSLAVIRDEEMKRIRGIQGLANQYGNQELADRLVAEGVSVEGARSQYLDFVTKTPQKAIAKPLGIIAETPQERKDMGRYSLRSVFCAMLGIADNSGRKPDIVFEQEITDEIQSRTGWSPKNGGFLVPIHDVPWQNLRSYAEDPYSLVPRYSQRANLTSPSSSGGYTIATDVLADSFLYLLRNVAKVLSMGVRTYDGLQGNILIPGQASAGQVEWISENNPGTNSDITFRAVTGEPHRIIGKRKYSDLLLKQSSISIEENLRMDLIETIALGIDKAAISGSGIGEEPLGLLNTPGVNTIDSGENGGTITWVNLIRMCRDIMNANANMVGNPGWLLNPNVWAALKATPIQANGVEGNFILGKDETNLLGYRFENTNQIPSNLEKGTGENLNAMILGQWAAFAYANWGILEVDANPWSEPEFSEVNVQIRATQLIDWLVRYPGAFSVATDIITFE